MKFLRVLCMALTVLSAISCSATKEVSILYWNIQNGMWADQGNNYDNFVGFVNEINPDVCIWCEAESRYITDSDKKMQMPEDQYLPWNWDMLASRYGHKYVLICGKRDTFPQVITSKYPLRIVKRINGNGEDVVVVHGAGWAKVEIEGKEINLVTLHTYPFKYAYGAEDQALSSAENGGDRFRAKEMQYICEQTVDQEPQAANQLWLMTGDFNAISSVDNFHYKRDLSDPAFLVHDYVRNNTPYIDLIEHLHPGEFHKSTLSGRRIDMVYVTSPLLKMVCSADYLYEGFPSAVRDSSIKKFCRPSDHYPALIKLKLR